MPRKFGEIYKEQFQKSASLREGKVLNDFQKVYSALLEKYNTSEFHLLNEDYQKVFLTELSSYWSEDEGISQKGEKFLTKNVDMLNEDSTTLQRRNFLKKKSIATINETIRQTDLKWKLYSVIDDMYKEVKASKLQEVLSPEVLVKTIHESLATSLKELITEINYELTESAKSKKMNEQEQFDGKPLSGNLSPDMFGHQLDHISQLDIGQEYILHEPGMDEWNGNLEYKGEEYGVHKFVSTLQFDNSYMELYNNELEAEINNGLVFEQI